MLSLFVIYIFFLQNGFKSLFCVYFVFILSIFVASKFFYFWTIILEDKISKLFPVIRERIERKRDFE